MQSEPTLPAVSNMVHSQSAVANWLCGDFFSHSRA
jgi:hypothetical protein